MTGKHTHFPMFIESTGKRALVIGGGAVAERRVLTLMEFGFEITVISDRLTETLSGLSAKGTFLYHRGRCFVDEDPKETGTQADAPEQTGAQADVTGATDSNPDANAPENIWIERWPADMILACTDDRELNRQIGAYGKRRNIPVNVCDAREESTFWFPAIALNEELTMGLVGDGTSHGTVRKAAAALREVIEERSYEK